MIGACAIIALHGSLRPELAFRFSSESHRCRFLRCISSVLRSFVLSAESYAALTPERIVRDGLLVTIVAAVFWGNLHRLDATLAMGATLLSSIVMLGLVSIFLRRLRPPALDGAKPAYTAEEWWRPTLPLTVMMIADNLMSRSAVIALGLTGNTRDAGIFAAAFSIATVTALPRMAVATAFAPTVSALFARGDQAGLQSLSAKAACLSLLGTACAAIPLLLLAQPILVWFGPDFVGRGPDRHHPRSRPDARCRMRASTAPHHDDWTRARRRNDFRRMRRLELRRLHAGHRFVRDDRGRLRHDGLTLIGWNVAMAIFIHRCLHLMPGLVASFKAMPGRRHVTGCGI